MACLTSDAIRCWSGGGQGAWYRVANVLLVEALEQRRVDVAQHAVDVLAPHGQRRVLVRVEEDELLREASGGAQGRELMLDDVRKAQFQRAVLDLKTHGERVCDQNTTE